MGRRLGGWPERAPRPKAAKLSREEQQRLQARAMKFVGKPLILREIVGEVQLARGRLHLRRDRGIQPPKTRCPTCGDGHGH